MTIFTTRSWAWARVLDMVKTLQDFCLACIARNITFYGRLGNFLSLRHKEVLLERMCWHEQLTPTSTPSVVYHLFSHTLNRVNLSYSDQVDDKILELLGKSGCKPSSFTILACPNVTDKGIAALFLVLRNVEELKLKKLKHITGKGLQSISSKTLRSVNLRESSSFTDAGVKALVQNCPNIEELNLSELHKLTDNAIIAAAESLKGSLVELDMSETNHVSSKSTLALAEHCKNLKIAMFESCVKLDGEGLIQIAECCSLSWLNISFCYKLTSQNIEIMISLLRAKGTLHTFEAMGIYVTPLAMEMVQSTNSLTRLSLCGVPALTDERLEQITRATGGVLVDLDISSCLALTDQSCASITRHCVALEVLGLRNNRDIKGTDLIKFFQDRARAKHFRSITMSGSKNLSPALVEAVVTSCPNLETITMAGLKDINDDIANAIAHCCPSIQQISFRNCNLTDEGVCEVAIHCSKLTMIALAGIHNLTDKCVKALAENCPYLRELYLSGCAKITRQAVTYLKDCAVGRVFVNHSTPNAPIGLLMAKDLDTGEYHRVDDLDYDPIPARIIKESVASKESAKSL